MNWKENIPAAPVRNCVAAPLLVRDPHFAVNMHVRISVRQRGEEWHEVLSPQEAWRITFAKKTKTKNNQKSKGQKVIYKYLGVQDEKSFLSYPSRRHSTRCYCRALPEIPTSKSARTDSCPGPRNEGRPTDCYRKRSCCPIAKMNRWQRMVNKK